jgi:hypothetical protein
MSDLAVSSSGLLTMYESSTARAAAIAFKVSLEDLISDARTCRQRLPRSMAGPLTNVLPRPPQARSSADWPVALHHCTRAGPVVS